MILYSGFSVRVQLALCGDSDGCVGAGSRTPKKSLQKCQQRMGALVLLVPGQNSI